MTKIYYYLLLCVIHTLSCRDYLYLESKILLLVYFFWVSCRAMFLGLKSVKNPAFFSLKKPQKNHVKVRVKVTFSQFIIKQITHVKMNLVHARKNGKYSLKKVNIKKKSKNFNHDLYPLKDPRKYS